ncbi:MAG: MmcQ/YjbR family DNA-binding protein [Bacteroidaceae bacterium]|nr:MmcQ/YjbR family DNA-binding protein [Bacteroidaceae bacterium]
MNIESVREYCLSLPHATEDFPFDETTLAFRIGGRIFAMIDLERTEWFVLKCNPDMAIELREKYAEISPAWHMNKRHWNQINLFGYLSEELICSLIRHSYSLVLQKLPKALRISLKGVTEVEGTVLAE